MQTLALNGTALNSQSISFWPPASPVTFGVSPIGLSASATSSLPVTFTVISGPGTISGTTLTVTGAGTIVVAANQAGNTSYAPAAEVQRSITVNQATPTITTAPTASAITYGQTLASSTLSGGVGSVAGTFAWTTPSTVPSAGTASYSVTFTPTDTVNYNTVTTSVSVMVNKATQARTSAVTATTITHGSTLSS